MKGPIAWVLFLAITVLAILCSAWFYISYGLFTPHSNMIYMGSALWDWKSLLVCAYTALGAMFAHSYFAGKALWNRNFMHAIKISSIVLVGLMSLFLVQLFFRYLTFFRV